MAPRFTSCFKRGGRQKPDPPATEISPASEEIQSGVGGKDPIVVELFSSQGCKTSPEAEILMSRLGRGDFNLDRPIIVLGFHVDYWDYMGWKDPFGSSQWTIRQKAYVEALRLDTMFTPQVVVQGRAHCVGNEEDSLLSNIASAPTFPTPSFQVSFEKVEPNNLQVSLTGQVRMKIDSEGVNIMAALYECGLVTDCAMGENKGRVICNDYVVRRLEKLCSVKDLSAKKTVSGTLELPLWEGFNAHKCGLVVFLQNSSHHIFGSQKFDLPHSL